MQVAIGVTSIGNLYLSFSKYLSIVRFVQEGRLAYLNTLTNASVVHNFTIVQLPQSISYAPESTFIASDDHALSKMDTSNFVLFTRQEDSFVFARSHYPRVDSRLSPDIAYALGPILPSSKPVYDVVIQMRQDKEVSELVSKNQDLSLV